MPFLRSNKTGNPSILTLENIHILPVKTPPTVMSRGFFHGFERDFMNKLAGEFIPVF